MSETYETTCPDCDGAGYDENMFGHLSGCGGANQCERCNGTGTITVTSEDDDRQ